VVNLNAVASFEFVPQAKVELHVKEGEKVTIIEMREPWVKVTKKSDGATGWVPLNYLDVLS